VENSLKTVDKKVFLWKRAQRMAIASHNRKFDYGAIASHEIPQP